MKLYFTIASASKVLVISASIWCFWVGYQIWTTPIIYEGIEISSSVNEITKTRDFSEISRLGVVPLVIPVLISLMAMWSIFKFKTVVLIIATVLLLAFWFLAGFSIGMAYTPAVILLVLASAINLIATWLNKKNI